MKIQKEPDIWNKNFLDDIISRIDRVNIKEFEDILIKWSKLIIEGKRLPNLLC